MLKRLVLQEVLVFLVSGGSSERLAAPLTAQVGGGIMELFDNGAGRMLLIAVNKCFWGVCEDCWTGQTASYS